MAYTCGNRGWCREAGSIRETWEDIMFMKKLVVICMWQRRWWPTCGNRGWWKLGPHVAGREGGDGVDRRGNPLLAIPIP